MVVLITGKYDEFTLLLVFFMIYIKNKFYEKYVNEQKGIFTKWPTKHDNQGNLIGLHKKLIKLKLFKKDLLGSRAWNK